MLFRTPPRPIALFPSLRQPGGGAGRSSAATNSSKTSSPFAKNYPRPRHNSLRASPGNLRRGAERNTPHPLPLLPIECTTRGAKRLLLYRTARFQPLPAAQPAHKSRRPSGFLPAPKPVQTPRGTPFFLCKCTVHGEIHRTFQDLHLFPQIDQAQSLKSSGDPVGKRTAGPHRQAEATSTQSGTWPKAQAAVQRPEARKRPSPPRPDRLDPAEREDSSTVAHRGCKVRNLQGIHHRSNRPRRHEATQAGKGGAKGQGSRGNPDSPDPGGSAASRRLRATWRFGKAAPAADQRRCRATCKFLPRP